MIAGPRRAAVPRLVVGIWVVVALVVWNGLYDFRISFGIRDYLLQAALHELGRAEPFDLGEMMAFTVRRAVTFATFWTALVLGAAVATVRLLPR